LHRFPVILCLIAITGSVISAALFFQIGDSKRRLEIQLSDAQTRSTKFESDLASANEQNGSLKATLASTTADLDSSKTRLATTESQVSELERNLVQTKSLLALQEQNARALSGEVTALRRDLDDARTSNASPEAVTAYKNTIAELERQLANAHNGAATPTAAGAANAVFSSRPGRATILTVGPQNAFVVLNFGSARGAQVGQRLNVSQGTEIVATVLISDVRANFSVAQVQPATLRGVLHKGDLALLIR
jgi:septal ring factor EnvC (AmiA/AmiB activator)